MAADNLQEQFNVLLEQLRALGLTTIELDRLKQGFDKIGNSVEEAEGYIESMGDKVYRLNSQAAGLRDSFSSLNEQLAQQVSELSSAGQILSKNASMHRNILTIARDISYDASGLIDLNGRDIAQRLQKLETLQEEFNLQKSIAKSKREQLESENRILKAVLTSNKTSVNSKKLAQNKINKNNEYISSLKEVENYNQNEDTALNGIIAKTKGRLDLERDISKAVGVTGALVQGAGALMERLGMRSGIFHDAMKESAQTMRDQAKLLLGQVEIDKEKLATYTEEIKELERKLELGEEITEEEEKLLKLRKEEIKTLKTQVTFLDRTKIALKGAGILAKGFGEALLDPAAITTAILTGFLDVNKASVDFTRLTGQSASALAGVNTEASTTVDLLKTAAELTKSTGLNAISIFTPDQIGQISDAKELLGLSAEQAGKLGMQMKLTGKSANQFNQEIYDSVNAFNRSTKSAISQKQALDDVLSASDAITASTGGNTKALGAAAAAARKLGMDLNKVDSIADGLMDFEQSIQNELEAQLLTGKNINLNKARELALNNDLEGVAKELAKNGASAAEFSKMNRIQQQALAKSLGMSREELAKSVLTQEAMANMTEEQIAAARGVSLEQSKQMDIQTRIQKSLDSLAQAFAPILEAVVPIVEMLLSVVQPIAAVLGTVAKWIGAFIKLKPIMFTLKVTVGAIAAYFAAMKIASWAGSAVKGIQSVTASAKGLMDNFKGVGSAAKGVWDTVKGLGDNIAESFNVGKDAVGKVADAAQDSSTTVTETVADKGKELLEDKLTDKTEDLVSSGADKTVDAAKGAADIPEAKSSGEKLKEFFTNLAAGLKEMASMEVVGGALALIPASLGLVAMVPGYLGAKLLETLDGEKLKSSLEGLANGLKAMANGQAALGSLGLIAAGLGFAAFTAGAIGMAAIALGGVAASAGLQALSIGLQAFGAAAMNPLTWAGVGLLAALGVALIPLTYALSKLAPLITAFGSVVSSVLGGIAGIITAVADGFTSFLGAISLEKVAALALLGPALMSVAGGLGILSLSMFSALPAIGMLGALAAMSGPLSTLATSLTAIAAGLVAITAALSNLETEKIEELKGLISSTALAAPAVAASGAISGIINSITGGGSSDSKNDPAMLDKLDAILAAIQAGGDVYMDGNKVGMSLTLATTRQ